MKIVIAGNNWRRAMWFLLWNVVVFVVGGPWAGIASIVASTSPEPLWRWLDR